MNRNNTASRIIPQSSVEHLECGDLSTLWIWGKPFSNQTTIRTEIPSRFQLKEAKAVMNHRTPYPRLAQALSPLNLQLQIGWHFIIHCSLSPLKAATIRSASSREKLPLI